MHPTPDFCVTQRKIYQHVGIFWRYPRRQSPTPTLKFALPPTPTPDASQWNIAGVGSQRKMLVLAMYISFFCVDFICVCTQREPNFRWNMGFIYMHHFIHFILHLISFYNLFFFRNQKVSTFAPHIHNPVVHRLSS